MRRLWVAALAIVLVLAVALAAGCGGDDDESGSKGSSGTPAAGAGGDAVDLTQKRDVNIAMVTHGDGGSFWAVAKRGAEDAAKDMGITLKYSESDNDPEKQAQLIQASVSEKVDGLAVSAPNPTR